MTDLSPDQATFTSGESVTRNWFLIPVVTTPKINPGETLAIDYYVTGSHPEDSPPEYVRQGLTDFPIESILEEPDTAGESSPR